MLLGKLFIHNTTIHKEQEVIHNGSILLDNGRIAEIYKQPPSEFPQNAHFIDGSGYQAVPGFIDGHIHGANGADVMDATEDALDSIASVLPEEGTTSFLATTITQSQEAIEQALANVASYQMKPGHAEMVGVHLEGPFVEKERAGAQPVEHIIQPDLSLFRKWQEISGHRIKTITMAPEHDADGEFIRMLADEGINVSAGHTGIDFAGMKRAVESGVRQVTHLCNAMSGIHHRDIGVVGAAFQLKDLRAELIADGIHVAPEMLEIIYKNVGPERLILITDAMRAKCLSPGDYELGGQPVKVTEDRAVLEDGTLAGSILKLKDGAKRMLGLEGATLEAVTQMASANPAKQLGMFDRKGSIAVGKDADLLLLDDELNIKYTICRGVIGYREEQE
ncbi:N-acetylglucosamine-6-phosphate deacetylase [Virgibacillus sediminis]|uniref:N-acetylglucosamine-6-phosphate deacetylase n=1 Tax=Virgibacillus sediminis TaxID=202260 RepID=A0ABV7A9H3_9BACI